MVDRLGKRRPSASQETRQSALTGPLRLKSFAHTVKAPTSSQLIIFLKAPRPGQVKTRLAAVIGAETACAAYRRLAETVLGEMAALPDVELCFGPDDGEADLKPWLRAGWTLARQGEGDLGQRLHRAFSRHFANGARRVVIVGSDCPSIRQTDIAEAWSALDRSDVVLGPATDGGYWLIGLSAPQPGLFEGIEWSTDRVLAQTLERAGQSGLKTRLLRELADVDTAEDWQRFLAGFKTYEQTRSRFGVE